MEFVSNAKQKKKTEKQKNPTTVFALGLVFSSSSLHYITAYCFAPSYTLF